MRYNTPNPRTALIIVFFAILLSNIFALDAPFAGDPAISPDGTQVCFVYDEDLWIVPFEGGTPRRITNSPSQEWNPQWSPDGSLIAFSSNREGQNFIYVMPATGGLAQAVSKENLGISEWFSDSKHLLCAKYSLRWGTSFYKVPLDGSRPILLAEVANRYATLSPDNKSIVFQQGGYTRREAYKGSANGELWLLDIPTKKYTKLTQTELSEVFPRFSQKGNNLYYCASDGESFQINKVTNLKFSKPNKLTSLTPFSARDINIARSNDRMVFEVFDGIYKFDPSLPIAKQVSRLNIDLSADEWQSTIVRSKMKNTFHNYAVSPDELLLAFNYQYDLFFMPRKGGDAKQVTFDHSGINNMQFLDNRTLVISKLDKGINRLFYAKADSVLSLTPIDWFGADSLNIDDFYKDDNGRWTFLYTDYFRHNKLAIADSGLVNFRAIDTPWSTTSSFKVNKSGTHAVFTSLRDDSYINELYLYDFSNGNIRRLLADDAWISNPFWTTDNKSILLSRGRSIFRLDLVPRDEFEFEKDNWQEILEPEKATIDTTSMGKDDYGNDLIDIVLEDTTTADSLKAVNIVWEGLEKRYYPVITTTMESLFVFDIISDSTFYYIEDTFLSDKNSYLKRANIYGKNIKEEINFGKEAGAYSNVGKTVYYLDGSQLKSYNMSTSSRKEIKAELDYAYDKTLLNQRVFEEAWGTFGNNFYDPDMHGKNWKKLYQLYRPYVDKARNINDVAKIISEMIGDVNASHTGFYPRVEASAYSNPPAYLGVEFDYSTSLPEGVKISRVYPSSHLAAYYKLTDGSTLTHVDGIKITQSTALDSLLGGKTGKRIKLRFTQNGNTIEATITGLSYPEARSLWYTYTSEQSRKLVDKLSNGKLGYIHIPAMGATNWSTFYTELFRDNFDKEALVIDVRGNTGGHIHDQIISLLQKKRYAYSRSRDGSLKQRLEPRRAWDKPSIVLVNEDSFSDGEIFPTIYQELKLGKVVGTPSSGAVIGTWQYYLLDGSSMRLPGTGWFKLDGTNMEGTGAMPDIIVDQLPADTIAERDPQLERAVKELMKELK